MSDYADDVGAQLEWWHSNSASWFVGGCVGGDFETTTKWFLKYSISFSDNKIQGKLNSKLPKRIFRWHWSDGRCDDGVLGSGTGRCRILLPETRVAALRSSYVVDLKRKMNQNSRQERKIPDRLNSNLKIEITIKTCFKVRKIIASYLPSRLVATNTVICKTTTQIDPQIQPN